MVIGLTFGPVTESAKMVPDTENNINCAETSSGISLKHNNYGNGNKVISKRILDLTKNKKLSRGEKKGLFFHPVTR